ncbi:putative chaperonin-like RbcX [Arabidopsis thaliana]
MQQALRILEVRSAYCKNDFEWDNMKRLAFKVHFYLSISLVVHI